jgi:general secretion pathway protein A
MYARFYRMTKAPFHVTPNPEFLFLSPSHKEAMASLIYGVSKGKGFIVITGEVGVGKTTVLRSYLEKIDQRFHRIIYIFNSNLSFKGLLDTIYHELDLERKTDDVVKMVNDLHRMMIEEYKQSRRLVLLIDEAQNMPVKTLENLRMLSNLETSTEKLLQIVLVGQPELEQILDRSELRQLKQRIAVHSVILPLTRREGINYIKHRLGKVAPKNALIFTRGSLKKIVRHAKGCPRTINILCDNALITGFGLGKRPVNSHIVREVIADLEGKTLGFFWKRVFAPAAATFLLLGLFWLAPYWSSIMPTVKEYVLSVGPPVSVAMSEIKPDAGLQMAAPIVEEISPPPVLEAE